MEPSGVEGVGQPQYSQEQIREYRDRYKRGVDLFQQAFTQYNDPQIEPHKKAQLRKVMSEALEVMNETASVALKKEKLEDERRLNENYVRFIENPGAETQKKVFDDIDSLNN
ncbi:MAG: hypothetical protein AAGE99_04960 [Chlamydiota bacterium]